MSFSRYEQLPTWHVLRYVRLLLHFKTTQMQTITLHISATAATTNSTTGDAGLQIVVPAPLSQGVTGELETNGYARQETEEQLLTK
jgi:hypothetical protein